MLGNVVSGPPLEGGLKTKSLSPGLSDWNMKHPGEQWPWPWQPLRQTFEVFSERQSAALWARGVGRSRVQKWDRNGGL
jgi:hypothetical protein